MNKMTGWAYFILGERTYCWRVLGGASPRQKHHCPTLHPLAEISPLPQDRLRGAIKPVYNGLSGVYRGGNHETMEWLGRTIAKFSVTR